MFFEKIYKHISLKNIDYIATVIEPFKNDDLFSSAAINHILMYDVK